MRLAPGCDILEGLTNGGHPGAPVTVGTTRTSSDPSHVTSAFSAPSPTPDNRLDGLDPVRMSLILVWADLRMGVAFCETYS